MSYLELTVWMEEHPYQALADRLVDDSTMEKILEKLMYKRYENCVPAEERARIEKIIVQEDAGRKAEEAASRRFVFIEAKKEGEPLQNWGRVWDST